MLNSAIPLDLSPRQLKGLNKIVSTIELGQGTAGKLVNDETLYQNLIEASKELESF